MQNKKKKIIGKVLMILVLAVPIFVICSILDKKSTFADSGFGVSYDGGGSSYSGGSSWDSYDSYDRYDRYDRYDSYSSNSRDRYSDNRSKSRTEVIFDIIFTVIFIIVAVYVIVKSQPSSRRLHNYTPQNTATVLDDSILINEIKRYIPEFDKTQFLNEGYKIYCEIQEAWMNFKLEDVKDIITDELYSMYGSQLATLEAKGEQNIMQGFTLNRSFLKDVTKQNETITITTGYIIEFYDYIVEQATGQVVRGTDKKKMRVTYEMKFRQTLNENKKVTKCPNCGAEIDMNTSGICNYCHTKIVTENTKWVLTEKKTMNQEYM